MRARDRHSPFARNFAIHQSHEWEAGVEVEPRFAVGADVQGVAVGHAPQNGVRQIVEASNTASAVLIEASEARPTQRSVAEHNPRRSSLTQQPRSRSVACTSSIPSPAMERQPRRTVGLIDVGISDRPARLTGLARRSQRSRASELPGCVFSRVGCRSRKLLTPRRLGSEHELVEASCALLGEGCRVPSMCGTCGCSSESTIGLSNMLAETVDPSGVRSDVGEIQKVSRGYLASASRQHRPASTRQPKSGGVQRATDRAASAGRRGPCAPWPRARSVRRNGRSRPRARRWHGRRGCLPPGGRDCPRRRRRSPAP